MGKFLHYSLERSLLVDLFSAVFGLGSWIAMTGLWVELPLLVQRLPEGWSLASYLALILQAANIGPIVYGVANRWWPKYMTERAATHGQLAIGTVSTLLLIFFWSSTVPIGTSRYSVALFVLSFGLSIVDCTSSVVFLPYMARFRSIYMTPYLVGEGVSGLVPSVVAIAQGIENPECVNTSFVVNVTEEGVNLTEYRFVPFLPEPRFSAEWFFAFLLGMVLISWLAFFLLDYMPVCKAEMVPEYEIVSNDKSKQSIPGYQRKSSRDKSSKDICELQMSFVGHEKKETISNQDGQSEWSVETVISSGRRTYLYLLFLQGWASIATFGIFPAIQPYSCLPYGDQPFHQVVTLSGIAYPVACVVAMFWEVRSILWVSVLSAVASLISVFIMITAIMSPTPPLVGTQIGNVVIVISWVLFIGIFSYVKTMVTVLLRDIGHDALFWCGAVTQAGAAVGALLMFLLVNVFSVFQDEGLCIV